MQRRTLLKSALAAGAGLTIGSSLLRPSAAASATGVNPFQVAKYRVLVPEIFRPLADAPDYTPVVIIGSGFGGAVSALRLAEAGIQSTVLERGSRWPMPTPWRAIFSGDLFPDGRAYWRQSTILNINGTPITTDYFGGVLDVVKFNGIDVWQGAGVGGGSLIYTAEHPIPQRDYFEHVFGTTLSYDEMVATYYPRAAAKLGTSTMPDDIYNSNPYSHSRTWDRQARAAGYAPSLLPGAWDWSIMRQELSGRVRRAATVGATNFGISNGVKKSLTLTYLKDAEATGKSVIYPGHEVLDIGQDGSGRYAISVRKVDPTGAVLSTRTISCDYLVLAAGSIGTTELLMRARQNGTLPNLNEHVGSGWGTNGDAAAIRGISVTGGLTQGVASRSMISDVVDGLPITMENWFTPVVPTDVGIIASLGMTLDDRRGDFTLTSDGKLSIDWPQQTDSISALSTVNSKIANASGASLTNLPLGNSVNSTFTAHPLGGAVLGKATDLHGRVEGHPGLYVMDGALIPGNSGAVNPAITIAALAERNMATIIPNGG